MKISLNDLNENKLLNKKIGINNKNIQNKLKIKLNMKKKKQEKKKL